MLEEIDKFRKRSRIFRTQIQFKFCFRCQHIDPRPTLELTDIHRGTRIARQTDRGQLCDQRRQFMHSRRLTVIRPGMSARSFGSDAIAPHPDRAMINMSKRESFQHKVTDHICAETICHTAHPAQVTKTFFADIRNKPYIIRQVDLPLA